MYRLLLVALILFIGSYVVDVCTFPIGDDPVFAREILSYEFRGDGTVAYHYVASALPPLLDPAEVISKRTESSYTNYLGVNENGEQEYQLVAYSDKTFVEKEGKWFARETGYTDRKTFAAAQRTNPIASLFWERAHAVDIYTGAGDGMVFADAVGSWAAAQSGTSGTVDDTSTTFLVEVIDDVGAFYIGRSFLPFDTSSIPAASTVTAALLKVYMQNPPSNDDNDGVDYITVVQTSQATHTALASTDYDNIGTTEGVDTGQRKDITSLSSGTYTTITLNATGRGWVAKNGQASACSGTAGVTCLGLREGHDITNNQIASFANNTVAFSSSEETGTAQDPYLSITYTTGFALSKPPNNLGLVGYWSFNEGTTTSAGDFSGRGFHGILTGSTLPLWTPGIRGNALEFNGTDTYVSVGGLSNTVQTVSFWLKADDTTLRKILDLDGSALIELNGSSQVTATGFTSPTVYVDGSTASAVVDTNWHHVVVTTGTGVDASAIDLGKVNTGYFDGKLDEVRMYNRALSGSEVAALYRSGATRVFANSKTLTNGSTLASQLIALFTFDGKDVQLPVSVSDTSNNNSTATFQQGTVKPVIGKLGQGLSFDGIELLVTDLISYSSSSISLAFWLRWDAYTNSNDVLFASGPLQSGLTAYEVRPDDSATSRFAVTMEDTLNGVRKESFSRPSVGDWHHYVLVLDGSTSAGDVVVYVDGAVVGTTIDTNTRTAIETFSLHELVIMANATVASVGAGDLDEVRIYDRALTAIEAKQLYTLGNAMISP